MGKSCSKQYNQQLFTLNDVASCLNTSKSNIVKKVLKGDLKLNDIDVNEKFISNPNKFEFDFLFHIDDLKALFPVFQQLYCDNWEEFENIKPLKTYKSIEFFAGCGGMALGLEKAGFHSLLLCDNNKFACQTLKENMPQWNVICDDIKNVDVKAFLSDKEEIDLLVGGFPCQPFSLAGNQLGVKDERGLLAFDLIAQLRNIKPKIFLAENVKGLLNNNKGETLCTIINEIEKSGYKVIEQSVFNAMFYKVPQKRERLILIALRKDLLEYEDRYQKPLLFGKLFYMKDVIYKGELFDCDISDIDNGLGLKYSAKRKEILDLVQMGENWKSLPLSVQKTFLGKSFNSDGGKTGMARRLHLNEPSLTLLCHPSQKQTERCHPLETRPLTIREYARTQTFPDNWLFKGSVLEQYKQIGNAVPVNLSYAIGKSLIRLLNSMDI